MATLKEGLGYFPLCVDFVLDELDDIMINYGSDGGIVVLSIISRIFKQGYYLEYNERLQRKIARKISEGIDTEIVDKVIQEAAAQGIFNEDMLTQHHILTSENIQLDYFRAVKRNKKEVKMELKYLLIEPDLKNKSNDKALKKNDPSLFNEALLTCDKNNSRKSAAKESKGKEMKLKETKENETKSGVFVSLTHTDSADAHVCEGKSPKKHQIEIFSKELIEKPGWIDELKATRIASERFFTDIEGYMRAYCSWLFVTGADKSIETLTDFSRRFYYWISKHGNKLRPEELERKDSAEKKETSEERFLRMRKEMLEQERMEEESRFQNSIN